MAPAQADVDDVLEISRERWGDAAAARYVDLISAALERISDDPEGPAVRVVRAGIGSYHLKHARRGSGVRDPVHVIFFRIVGDTVEILRILHEHMDPALHSFHVIAKRR